MDILKNAGKIAVVANIQHPDTSSTVPDEEAEFDSPETVEAIRAALERGGAEAILLEADACLAENLKKEGVDFTLSMIGTGADTFSPDLILKGVSSPVIAQLRLDSAPHVCTISPEYGKTVGGMADFLKKWAEK